MESLKKKNPGQSTNPPGAGGNEVIEQINYMPTPKQIASRNPASKIQTMCRVSLSCSQKNERAKRLSAAAIPSNKVFCKLL